MKTVRKALLLVLCAALLAGATAMGTYAYFTSTDSATNTFTIGKVTITLDEAKVGEDGKALDHGDRVKANTYNNVKPGQDYDKDPTVTVLKGSEKCYVRMLVTVTYDGTDNDNDGVSNADEVLAAYNYESWFDWSKDWANPAAPTTVKADGKISRTYEFRYVGNDTEHPGNGVVVKNANSDTVLADLFTKIRIPDAITGPELATLEGLTINIVAQAIQADGFDNAEQAWAKWSN